MNEFTVEYSAANKAEMISQVLGLALNKGKLKRKNTAAPSMKRMILTNIMFGVIILILSSFVNKIPGAGASFTYLFLLMGALYVFFGFVLLYQWKKAQKDLADCGKITIDSNGIRDEDSAGRGQTIPWGDVDVVFVSDEVIAVCQKKLPVVVFCDSNSESKNTRRRRIRVLRQIRFDSVQGCEMRRL